MELFTPLALAWELDEELIAYLPGRVKFLCVDAHFLLVGCGFKGNHSHVEMVLRLCMSPRESRLHATRKYRRTFH